MKKNKGFTPILIVLAVLVVLVVGSVAYYAGKNSKTIPQSLFGNNSQVSQTGKNNVAKVSAQNNVKTQTSDVLNGKYTGYLKSISTKNGKNYLVIDYVEMVSCEYDATTDSCPDGYKIVNDNPLLRTLPIASNAKVEMSVNATPATASLSKLITILQQLSPTAKGDLCNITLKNGLVTDITEIYLP